MAVVEPSAQYCDDEQALGAVEPGPQNEPAGQAVWVDVDPQKKPAGHVARLVDPVGHISPAEHAVATDAFTQK
jgi:hypothetical protein